MIKHFDFTGVPEEDIEDLSYSLVPYNNRDGFKSKTDFVIFIKDFSYKTIGQCSSVDEIFKLIESTKLLNI